MIQKTTVFSFQLGLLARLAGSGRACLALSEKPLGKLLSQAVTHPAEHETPWEGFDGRCGRCGGTGNRCLYERERREKVR